LKRPIAVSQEYDDVVEPGLISVRQHQIQFAVAVEISGGDIQAALPEHVRDRRLKRDVTVAQRDADAARPVGFHGSNQVHAAISVEVAHHHYSGPRRHRYRVAGSRDRPGLGNHRLRDHVRTAAGVETVARIVSPERSAAGLEQIRSE